MQSDALIARLAANRETYRGLVADLPEELGRWRPADDQWSILEIVCHLVDEEREDFRTRLDLTLHRPQDPWPSIDPQGWVAERRYRERSLGAALRELLAERDRSLVWLSGLAAPDWRRAHEHPRFGPIAAGDLLVSWAAHDFLHIRQLARRHWEHACKVAQPFSSRYAGDW